MTCKVSSDLDSIYICECEPCGVVDGAHVRVHILTVLLTGSANFEPVLTLLSFSSRQWVVVGIK